MISLYPAYAVGIRSHRAHGSDAFAQPRCHQNALHGVAIGAWEHRTLMPGEAVPDGWRVVDTCGDRRTIKLTHWERISL